jgi:hypothetical protein
MVQNYCYWSKKLGPFPFSASSLKPLLTYVNSDYVFICEGENQEGGQVKQEDLNGKGVSVNKDGNIKIGYIKKGKADGLRRFISGKGSE